jgi:hypothetical protein
VSSLKIGSGVRSFYENAKQVKISGHARFHYSGRGGSDAIIIGHGEHAVSVSCPHSTEKIPCHDTKAMHKLLSADQVTITYYERKSKPAWRGSHLGEVKSIETPTIQLTEDPLQRDLETDNRVFSIALSILLSAILYVAAFFLIKSTGFISK